MPQKAKERLAGFKGATGGGLIHKYSYYIRVVPPRFSFMRWKVYVNGGIFGVRTYKTEKDIYAEWDLAIAT